MTNNNNNNNKLWYIYLSIYSFIHSFIFIFIVSYTQICTWFQEERYGQSLSIFFFFFFYLAWGGQKGNLITYFEVWYNLYSPFNGWHRLSSGRKRGQYENGQMGKLRLIAGLPNKISCSMSTHLLPCGRTSGGQIRGSLMHERGWGQGRRAERHTEDEKKKSSNLLIKFAE